VNVAFLCLYLATHALGFAGIAMVIFIAVYERDPRDVRYLVFLLGFFLYVALSHAAFVCAAYLGMRDYFLEPWYFVAYMAVTSAVMATYSVLFHALPKTRQRRWHLARHLAFSCVPVALLAVGFLPDFSSEGERILLMRLAALVLVALLAYSIVFMARNMKNAIDAECAMMMRFTIAANSLFIVPFLFESWHNLGPARPVVPMSAETVYYLALSVVNVGWLAHGVLVKRTQKADADFSAREVYARAALAPETLTDREKNVLAYLLLGLGNKQIAAHLELTEYVVRNHVSALLKKSGARNRVELVELYRKTLSR
jgi:DNA-binding CsgD family transcriptional regulator